MYSALFTHLTIPSLVAARIFVLGAGITAIAANAKASFGCVKRQTI